MFVCESLGADAEDGAFEEDELHEGYDSECDVYEDLSRVGAHG